MYSLKGFLNRKWAWANQKKLPWIHLALLAGTMLCFSYPGPSDFRVRAWGGALQLIGLVTVWYDLSAVGRAYGKPGWVKGTLEWVKAGLFGTSVTLVARDATIRWNCSTARVTQRDRAPDGATLDRRIVALEANFQKLDQELGDALGLIEKARNDAQSNLEKEREDRKAANAAAAKQLEDAVVGNHAVLSAGVVWLAFGVIFATFSPEIVKVLAGNWRAVWATV